jgi:hypothetical protein
VSVTQDNLETDTSNQTGLTVPAEPIPGGKVWTELISGPGVSLLIRPGVEASELVLARNTIDLYLAANRKEERWNWEGSRPQKGDKRFQMLTAFAETFTEEYSAKRWGAFTRVCETTRIGQKTARRWLDEIRANDHLVSLLPPELREASEEVS